MNRASRNAGMNEICVAQLQADKLFEEAHPEWKVLEHWPYTAYQSCSDYKGPQVGRLDTKQECFDHIVKGNCRRCLDFLRARLVDINRNKGKEYKVSELEQKEGQ